MDIKAYIKSGILEQYCLGLLNNAEQADVQKHCAQYPQIKNELIKIETAMEEIAKAKAIEPSEITRQKILDALGFEEGIDLNNPPLLDARANYKSWLKAVEPLMPPQPFELNETFAKVLKDENGVRQTLIITRDGTPEEIHDNLLESFLILQGRCVCNVGKEIIALHAGNFLEIPLYTPHDVTIATPYVVAIFQEITL